MEVWKNLKRDGVILSNLRGKRSMWDSASLTKAVFQRGQSEKISTIADISNKMTSED